MRTRQFAAWIFSVGLMNIGVNGAYSQDFPARPLRIVVQGDAGGGLDFLARMIAQGLTGSLGQRVIVDNRPSGVIPGDIVSKSSPDGYTMLLSSDLLWIGPLFEKTPYDPIRDFSPITIATKHPNVLVVNPSFPAKSVEELIALAKAKPGSLNYASTGIGGTSHLAAELFKAMAGINIERIPYKGSGLALNGLVGGETQLMFSSTSSAAPYVHSGRVRTLAVSSTEPSKLAPGLPTVAATVPGYESGAKDTLFAPAKTPAAIIDRLNREIVRVLNTPEVKERLFNEGTEVVASSPQQLAAEMKADMARIRKLIKDADIRAK